MQERRDISLPIFARRIAGRLAGTGTAGARALLWLAQERGARKTRWHGPHVAATTEEKAMTQQTLATAALILTGTAFAATAQVSWDLNADGELSPSEFVNGFGNLSTYASFDRDGDAKLTAAEWENGLGTVGEYVNMDLNGDGGVDEVEFNALLFNRYDGDGSGTIDTGEIALVEADLAEDGLLAR